MLLLILGITTKGDRPTKHDWTEINVSERESFTEAADVRRLFLHRFISLSDPVLEDTYEPPKVFVLGNFFERGPCRALVVVDS